MKVIFYIISILIIVLTVLWVYWPHSEIISISGRVTGMDTWFCFNKFNPRCIQDGNVFTVLYIKNCSSNRSVSYRFSDPGFKVWEAVWPFDQKNMTLRMSYDAGSRTYDLISIKGDVTHE